MSFRYRWHGGADTNSNTSTITSISTFDTSTITKMPNLETSTIMSISTFDTSTITKMPNLESSTITSISTFDTSTITKMPNLESSTMTTTLSSISTVVTTPPFAQLTISQLSALSDNELKSYAAKVSTSIIEQSARVKEQQKAQDDYQKEVMLAESTVKGLKYEVLEDENVYILSKRMYSSIINSNINIDSTIKDYNRQIADQQLSIETLNGTILNLKIEGSNIESTLGDAYTKFDRDAKYYSSLYIDFLTKDTLYKTCLNDISTTSSLLTLSMSAEADSKQKLDGETIILKTKRDQLSTLNQENKDLQSTLATYILEEATAKRNVISTNDGIITLSSYYETAKLNQKYYQNLSTQGGIQLTYATAQSNSFQAKQASDANPANQSLLAIYKTASAAENSLYTKLQNITSELTTTKSALNISASNAYDTNISTAQSAINVEINNISTFQANIDNATILLKKYSSLYDQSILDITSCQQVVTKFNELYRSSIDGSNAIMMKVADITNSNNDIIARVTILENTILDKEKQYSSFLSSYTGWIEYSTLMDSTIIGATSNYISYSTSYKTANDDVIRLTKDLAYTKLTKMQKETNIITYSTIKEEETLNILEYTNKIHIAGVMEEKSGHQYRETLVRDKRKRLQEDYDAAILIQVELASTINGDLAAKGTAYTPVPININVPSVDNVYNKLNAVTDYLNSFQPLYETYDMKLDSLQSISSIILPQYTKLKTINELKLNLLTSDQADEASIGYSDKQSDFIESGIQIEQKKAEAYKYDTINTIKKTHLETYKTFFTPSEFLLNENTISSFLIQGYTS